MTELLIENMPFSFKLEESAKGSNKLIVRGQFARGDVPTANKRFYSEALWKREIGRLNEAIQARRCFGELDHPSDGRTKLQRASHIITGLTIEGSEVIGEAEILDTPNGRILKAFAEAGAQVGVSSRGFGSIKQQSSGVMEVQEDFKLDTFDFVADPAMSTAYPKVVSEAIEREHAILAESMGDLDISALQSHYSGIVEAIKESVVTPAPTVPMTEDVMRDKVANGILRQVETLRESMYQKALSELSSDPAVAGAKTVLAEIAALVGVYAAKPTDETLALKSQVEELKKTVLVKEADILTLKSEVSEAKTVAANAERTMRVELRARETDSSAIVVELVGDVSRFESLEALDAKVESVISDLLEREIISLAGSKDSERSEEIEALEARAEKLGNDLAKAKADLSEANEKFRVMESHANRAVGIAEDLNIRLSVEKKIIKSGHGAHAAVLRELTEDVSSEAEIDAVIGRFTPPKTRVMDGDEAERIRARVGNGVERSIVEETTPRERKETGETGLLGEFGLSESRFDKLAGQ